MGFGCMVLCASIDPRACLSAQSLVSQRFISLCRVLWGPSKPRSLFLPSPASFYFYLFFFFYYFLWIIDGGASLHPGEGRAEKCV